MKRICFHKHRHKDLNDKKIISIAMVNIICLSRQTEANIIV
jgi:hypothetical protein